MMTRLVPILALLALAACGPSAEEARRVLDEAEQAGRDRSYRGIVVRTYSLDGQERTSTVRIHHAPGATLYEATLAGTDETWSHFSERSPDVHWMGQRDLLLESYDLVHEGEDRVAGRPTLRYRLRARMPDRPSRRFWLDRDTRLMLRDEGIDVAGRVFEAMRFETVEFDVGEPLPGLDVEPRDTVALREVDCRDLEAVTGFRPYVPRSLPEGFRLLRCHVQEVPEGRGGQKRPGAVLVYGDGLAQFVISQWLAETAGSGDGDEEVEVRRRVRRGDTWLGLRLDGTRIDVRSRTVGSDLLLDVVATLTRSKREAG